MDHLESPEPIPSTRRRKLGRDGLTKDQRYYRRNAEQVKKRLRDRRRQQKEEINPQITPSMAGDQADPPPTPKECLGRLIQSSNKIGYFFIRDGLDNICFQGKRGLLELRAQVEGWFSLDGDELRWNQIAEGRVRDAERSGDLDCLSPVLSQLEEKRSAGEFLMYRLNTWTIEDQPSNITDAMIAFKVRCELFIYIAKVLCFIERWIGALKDRLGRPVPCDDDDNAVELAVEEGRVEAELLSDTSSAYT